jgi:hypothetical protein
MQSREAGYRLTLSAIVEGNDLITEGFHTLVLKEITALLEQFRA